MKRSTIDMNYLDDIVNHLCVGVMNELAENKRAVERLTKKGEFNMVTSCDLTNLRNGAAVLKWVKTKPGMESFKLLPKELQRKVHGSFSAKWKRHFMFIVSDSVIGNEPQFYSFYLDIRKSTDKRSFLMEYANVCNFCLKESSDLKTCSKCESAKYCGIECQKQHWPEHRQDCF